MCVIVKNNTCSYIFYILDTGPKDHSVTTYIHLDRYKSPSTVQVVVLKVSV